MNGSSQQSDTNARRVALAIALAIGALVATRLRGRIPAYRALHFWLLDVGTPHVLVRGLGGLALIVTALVLARLVAGKGQSLAALGIQSGRNCARGLGLGLLIGLPMLLQAAVSANGVRLDSNSLHVVLTAPVNEEIFFRGMLVLIPVYAGGWRFWSCAIAAGLAFGSVHLPWDDRIGWGYAPAFIVTSAGGIWYAWLLRCFDRNIWLTIALHGVMNASWQIFAISDDAAGGLWPNIGRGLTIAFGTMLAMRHVWRTTN